MSNLNRPVKNILKREEAFDLFRPYLDELLKSVQVGLDFYATFDANQRVPLKRRTLAGILNDGIVDDARRRFDGTGVVINDDFETSLFVFDGQAALRFKKVDNLDFTSNVTTDRQRDFDFQQLELPGIPLATFVTLGYCLNDIWTEIRRVRLICRYGDSVMWVLPVSHEIQPLLLPVDVSATRSRSRVRSTTPKKMRGTE